MSISIDTSATAVFVNNVATALIQNGTLRGWSVKLMNISTTSLAGTRCTVYANTVNPSNQRDFTRTGNGDTSPCDIQIRPGESLIAQWVGGDNGATAIITIQGEAT